jgi:hypothetical protein
MQPDDAGVAHWPLTLGLFYVLVCDGVTPTELSRNTSGEASGHAFFADL